MQPLNASMVLMPQPPKPTIIGFGICQYDLPGSRTPCTAIAIAAAKRFIQADGQALKCFGSHDAVMEILAQGVAWHSRWLAAGEGRRVAFEPDVPNGCNQLKGQRGGEKTMATADEICAHKDVGMRVTSNCFFGRIGKPCQFGKTMEESICDIFSMPKQKPQGYILTTNGFSTMIGCKGNTAVIFDSHRRSPIDGLPTRSTKDGGAVLVHCPDPSFLILYLRSLYAGCGDSFYSLQEIAPEKSSAAADAKPQGIGEKSCFIDGLKEGAAKVYDMFDKRVLLRILF